jgi:plastocyanin
LDQQKFRRLGAMSVTAALALVVLAGCGNEGESVLEEATRVPVVSDAAAQATREAAEAPPETEGEGAEAAASPEAGGEAPAAAESVEVVSVDIAFQPTEVTIPANTDVTFSLPNNGAAPHNFSIDELGISVDQAPGAVEEVVINAPAGEYEYYCNVPGHKEAGMVGTLIVTEDAAAAPAAAEEPAAADEAAAPAPAEEEAAAEQPAAAATAEVVSVDIAFQPAELTIPANTDVTVNLPNQGAAPHNFSIDALGISVDQAPGATESVVINAPAGEYEYYCNVPGHKEAGMVGTLIVTEDAAPAPDAAGAAAEQAVSPEAVEVAPGEATPAAATAAAETIAETGAASPVALVETIAAGGSPATPAATIAAALGQASPTAAAAEQAAATPAASPVGEATPAADGEAAAAESVEVVSVDIAFEPAALTIPADTDVTFVLPNNGAAPHNFSIDELGISVDQAPGATEEVVINAPAGEYEYYCNVPGHKEAGMVGTLTVE